MSQHKYNNSRDNNNRTYNRKSPQYPGVTIPGLSIKVWDGNVTKALRTLKKRLQTDGKLYEIKERQYFVKRSELRKRAKEAARKRHLREVAENNVNKKRLY